MLYPYNTNTDIKKHGVHANMERSISYIHQSECVGTMYRSLYMILLMCIVQGQNTNLQDTKRPNRDYL